MYNIIQETNRQSRFDIGCLGLVHWDDPEGRDGMGREVKGGFRIGNTCGFMLMYGKTNTVL